MTKKIKTLHIDRLVINPNNDRHGELKDETAAIAELLKSMPDKMKKLSKDIALTGELFMTPLVGPTNKNKFVVFDGNRRVTCLKMLHKPHHAPTEEWITFFSKVAKEHSGNIPEKIECQLETDQDWIDSYLFRVHTGSQDGVGQINWNNPAKVYFVERTGKSTKLNLPVVVEEKLRSEGFIDESLIFRHTNLERLLSSEEFRSRVGISTNKKEIIFIRDVDKSLGALTRIVNDLASGTLNLNHLLRNENKRKYLDGLEKKGILPTAHDILEEGVDFLSGKKTKDPIPSDESGGSKTKKRTRNTLIRDEDGYGLKSQSHTKRAMDIWEELQHHLKFGEHNNAIAVLTRVLLELAIENYIKRKSVTLSEKDRKSFVRRFKKSAAHMLAEGVIDDEYYWVLKKLENKTLLLSIDTLHSYVHSKHIFPSSDDLKSKWDTLADFVVVCLKA